jgi:hypothetical protein
MKFLAGVQDREQMALQPAWTVASLPSQET